MALEKRIQGPVAGLCGDVSDHSAARSANASARVGASDLRRRREFRSAQSSAVIALSQTEIRGKLAIKSRI